MARNGLLGLAGLEWFANVFRKTRAELQEGVSI
jgi:hypothetical protein